MNKRSLILFLGFCFAIIFVANSQNQKMNADSVFTIAEVGGQPVGGMIVLFDSLKRNMPSCLYRLNKRMGIDSKYFFQFIISKNGSSETGSFKVIRPKEGISEDCVLKMEEILSEIAWEPAEYNCDKVRQRISFPICICLK